MPKRDRKMPHRGGRARSIRAEELRPVTVAGKTIIYPPCATSGSGDLKYGAVNIHPTTLNSDRLTAISDTFMAYRFTRMVFHLHPITLDSPVPFGSQVCIAYTPVLSQSPATFEDLVEVPCSLIKSAATEQHVTSLPVGRGYSAGFLTKWLRTRVSTVPDDFEYQGVLFAGVRSTVSTNEVPIVVEWECQFKDPVATQLSKTHFVESYPDDDSKSFTGVPLSERKGLIARIPSANAAMSKQGYRPGLK